MFKRKQKLEPITLKMKLPENGSYPPRILSPEQSIWLHGELVTFEDMTFAKKLDNRWSVTVSNKRDILVNGQKIVTDCVLNDGDYLVSGKWKGIYQSDPVADFRQGIAEAKPEDVYEINPSQSLREWVRIDYESLSLDGGESVARWCEILSIVYTLYNNGWQISLLILEDGKPKKLPSKLKRITNDDFLALISWVYYHTPVLCSIRKESLHEVWLDAYGWTAYNKVLVPSEDKKRDLPDTPENILGLRTKWQQRFDRISPIIGFLVVILLISFAITSKNSTISFIEAFIGNTIVIGLLLVLFVFAPRAIIYIKWKLSNSNE